MSSLILDMSWIDNLSSKSTSNACLLADHSLNRIFTVLYIDRVSNSQVRTLQMQYCFSALSLIITNSITCS
jgi:hypothetical protein